MGLTLNKNRRTISTQVKFVRFFGHRHTNIDGEIR